MVTTRAGTAADGLRLQEIEVRAGRRFAEVGLDDIADDDGLPLDRLAGYADDGRLVVAIDDDDAMVGYLVVDRVDDAAHVEQVSVDPDQQGRGVGRLLVDRAAAWAVADEVGPGLAAVISDEAAHGLDPATPVAMRQDL